MVLAAYLHIPFCEHICHYCDFNKFYLKGQPVDGYLQSLKQEIRLTLEKYPSDGLRTIFVGGGTPTALNEKQLYELCEIIAKGLPTKDSIEYTFEANPGDLSKEKLQILFDAGVNRLSFGVQSFNDELLKKIGRTHRSKDVFETIHLAKKVGFENISIDLIYSLPGQTIEDLQETLRTAYDLHVPHFSAYSLIVEPKTQFYNLMRVGQLHLPGEEAEAKMYETVMEQMEKHGYKQYEISNFSQPGFESRHNLTYWDNEEYYGFGAGAHSYINGTRRANFSPLKKYMSPIEEGKLPTMEEHILSKTEKIEEEMFLGLRKVEGVSCRKFSDKYGVLPTELFFEKLTELTQKGLIIFNDDYIQLTRQGRLLGNEVFEAFLLSDEISR